MSNIGSGIVHIDHDLDGQSQVTWILWVISLACIISTAAVVLRIYTRLRILPIFGPDDILMGIAAIISIAAATTVGLGKSRLPLIPPPPPPPPNLLTR